MSHTALFMNVRYSDSPFISPLILWAFQVMLEHLCVLEKPFLPLNSMQKFQAVHRVIMFELSLSKDMVCCMQYCALHENI